MIAIAIVAEIPHTMSLAAVLILTMNQEQKVSNEMIIEPNAAAF